ncbi:MAG: ParA family protein [gamma proteobacterium symbiont of Taylorina sp.]|nr:ParA family protein [gamma proteobacterium symbiont of Taylorina sp.]
MNKTIKILTISSKGGVGKSTIAMQIVTPYLYLLNNKNPIKYYEFDDDNKDYLSFGASNLSVRKTVNISDDFIRDEITEIFSQNESVCVDIGGNKTTTLALNAFKQSGMIYFIDLVIIPLLDGEQDGINASIIYQTLKHLNPEIKILFILNKAKNINKLDYQFENYFGDPRGIFSEKYALKSYLSHEDFENYAIMPENDVIKYSRRFGYTIYEIAKQKRDFITDLRKNMSEYSSEKEIKLVSFKNYMDHSTKEYFKEVIVPIFKKLNMLLGGK